MNSDSFLRHIENTRDCNKAALDEAVTQGIFRAKSNRLDSGKLIMLGAACVFVVAMCFTVNMNLFDALTEKYFQSRNHMMPGASQALDGYIKDIAVNAKKYFGGM